MIIEGNVSVKAAVMAGNRDVHKIFVDSAKRDKDTVWILSRAKEKNIPVTYLSREEIDQKATGRTHGGLLAEVGSRQYQQPDYNKDPLFIALVEGVEDPFNLGYIMRTLYSAGCDALILRNRDWQNAETTILKSSAGASEYLPIILSDDLPATIRGYKQHGVKCFAAMRKDAITCYEGDYTGSVLIAIGGEMRGLSAGVRKEMEQNIYIPYANDFRMALNAAGAVAVIGFEVYRQRHCV